MNDTNVVDLFSFRPHGSPWELPPGRLLKEHLSLHDSEKNKAVIAPKGDGTIPEEGLLGESKLTPAPLSLHVVVIVIVVVSVVVWRMAIPA